VAPVTRDARMGNACVVSETPSAAARLVMNAAWLHRLGALPEVPEVNVDVLLSPRSRPPDRSSHCILKAGC
jgi:hypothetical protein